MSAIVALDITSFDPALTPEQRELAVRTVEEDGVLALPHVDFALTPAAQRFLSAEWSDGRAKNISFDGAAPKGARGSAEDRAALAAMWPGSRATHRSSSPRLFRATRRTSSARVRAFGRSPRWAAPSRAPLAILERLTGRALVPAR
jgi:hypothetical protein